MMHGLSARNAVQQENFFFLFCGVGGCGRESSSREALIFDDVLGFITTKQGFSGCEFFRLSQQLILIVTIFPENQISSRVFSCHLRNDHLQEKSIGDGVVIFKSPNLNYVSFHDLFYSDWASSLLCYEEKNST